MRLYELTRADSAHFTLPKSYELDDQNTGFVGTFDHHDIYGTSWYNDHIAYFIKDNEKIIAMIIITEDEHEISGINANKLARIWVDDEYRNKGLATSLIAFIVKKMNIKLWFDHELTDDGIFLLKSLIKSIQFKKTYSDKMSVTNIEPDNLFDMENNWNVLIEKTDVGNNGPLDGVRNTKLHEYKYFTGGDYL